MIDYDSLESIKKMEIEIAFAVRRRPHFHPFFTPLFSFAIESQVRTFYSISNITSDSQPFLEFFLLIFGFLCHNMNIYLIPNAIRRRQNRDFKIYGPSKRGM